jgi:hypothetical protein
MPILNYPISPDGLAVEVQVSLSRPNVQALRTAGKAVPQALTLRALIDTGTDLTSVVDASIAPLGLLPVGHMMVNTANGRVIVNRYAISMSILDPTGMPPQHLVRPNLGVLGMANAPIGFDVMIGMDVLQHCLLQINGSAGQFLLAF